MHRHFYKFVTCTEYHSYWTRWYSDKTTERLAYPYDAGFNSDVHSWFQANRTTQLHTQTTVKILPSTSEPMATKWTSGQRKLTKKSHHHCTWTVQSYICQMSPMCTTTCFLGPIWVHTPNGISISSAVFAQLMAEGSYTLQRAIPIPLNIALVHGGSGPPSNTISWAHRSP